MSGSSNASIDAYAGIIPATETSPTLGDSDFPKHPPSTVTSNHDPIDCLPFEISAEIFQQCLPDFPSPELQEIKRDDDADNMFSQRTCAISSVNRNWRKIACSSPEFWNSVLLTIDCKKFANGPGPPERLATLMSNLELRLQRSRSLPLNIRLRLWNGLDGRVDIYPVMEAFCMEAHRWKNVCIMAPEPLLKTIPTYSAKVTVGAPQLSSLIVLVSKWGSTTNWPLSVGSPGAQPPAPHYLRLAWFPYEYQTTSFDFSRLTGLEIAVTPLQFLQLLAIAPCLITLKARIQGRGEHSAPPVEHTSLKVLDVAGGPFPQVTVTLPSLESLKCIIHEAELPILRDHLIRSSSGSLKTLRLDSFGSDEDVISILDLTPELHNLHLNASYTTHFFQHFGTTTNRSSGFLPQLQTFRFRGHFLPWGEFNRALFHTMIPEKSTIDSLGYRPLSRVNVDIWNPAYLPKDDDLDMKEFLDRGVEIIFNYVCDEKVPRPNEIDR